MTREEQLACLKDRPCDVCKMRTDKGCSSWECVFEQTPDEEKEPCDCIIRANVEKIKEIMTDINGDSVYVARMKDIRALPSIQPTTKENLVVGDCISREEVCDYIAEFVNHEYATDRERELVKNIIDGIQHLPSIQPKTGHWVSKHIVDDCNGVVTWYECSECGRSVDETVTEKFMLKDYPYCHCGARMLPTDSEKE